MNTEIGDTRNKIDPASLAELVSFLDSFGKPYFIHAGFGLYLRGFGSELDDIDVKVFHNNLEDIGAAAQARFDTRAVLKEGGTCHFGSYLFPRVEINMKTRADICTRTGAVTNIGAVEFPYSPEIFNDVDYFDYDGMRVPVSSLELLFLYYLVLRRTPVDGKNDEAHIREIIHSGKLREEKFLDLILDNPKRLEITSLYNVYKSDLYKSSRYSS